MKSILPVFIGVVAGLACDFISQSLLGLQSTIGGDLVAASMASSQLANYFNNK
jgi:cell shape-determining protein MreD